MVEGSHTRGDITWTPPGIACFTQDASGTDATGRFTYDGAWRLSDRTGSWPTFLGGLLAGVAVVGLALLRRPGAPAWLRLTAVTTIAFAVAGAGAFMGGWQGSALVGVLYAPLVAFAADWWFEPGRRGAGLAGAAVAFAAAVVASAGDLYGFGLAAYGVTLLLVAALAAVPWRRSSTPSTTAASTG